MSPELEAYARACRERVDAALDQLLPTNSGARLLEAMRYSLFSGGKRVRPLLVYAAAEALGRPADPALDTLACALEAIHAYSLVHDDLPAMDDDDLRRGQPTCHIAFGEATAILCGDALQALAFELLAEAPHIDSTCKVELVRLLASAAGADGMVMGQARDLEAVDRELDLVLLEAIHRLKTGALIRAAVAMGARVAGADPGQLAALDRYAAAVGLAFQVQDDILDVVTDTATLGKQQGADSARNKPTYVSLLGLDAAREHLQRLHEEALTALEGFGTEAERLRQLSAYVVQRGY